MSFELLVLAALLAWTRGAVPPQALEPWADAMGAVCSSEAECIDLAAQAFVESRFVPWVLDGSCNDPAWRASRRGWERRACDGGLAVGPWQIHGLQVGAAPREQARIALHLMRSAPELWTTWRAARSHAAWWLRGGGAGGR